MRKVLVPILRKSCCRKQAEHEKCEDGTHWDEDDSKCVDAKHKSNKAYDHGDKADDATGVAKDNHDFIGRQERHDNAQETHEQATKLHNDAGDAHGADAKGHRSKAKKLEDKKDRTKDDDRQIAEHHAKADESAGKMNDHYYHAEVHLDKANRHGHDSDDPKNLRYN